jgi:hypothetical protein
MWNPDLPIFLNGYTDTATPTHIGRKRDSSKRGFVSTERLGQRGKEGPATPKGHGRAKSCENRINFL